MFQTTLRSLWVHKRRLVATALAVLLGVAFMTGTLVLSSTLDRTFNDLFAAANAGVDAEVRGAELFETERGGPTLRERVAPQALQDVRNVTGVAAAEPDVMSFTGTLLDARGDAMGSFGPPTVFSSWIDDPALASFSIETGRAPRDDDEVVLNRAAADDGGYQVGDRVNLLTGDGRTTRRLVGLAAFGEAGSAGGITNVFFTLDEIQRLAGAGSGYDEVLARAVDGVTQAELVRRIEPVLPVGVNVVTGEQSAEELASSVQEGFSFLSQILFVFAAIALFVGTFIISNTFSILLAQRTRELALFRAIGASRRQVLGSVLAEAAAVGVAAAIAGLAAGVVLAAGSLTALRTAGVEVPETEVAVGPTTFLIAIGVGLAVTAGAAFLPAIRGTRVPPVAALRDVTIDRASRSWVRTGLGGALLVVAAIAFVPAFGTEGGDGVLVGVGVGAFAALAGLLILGPLIAEPGARALGAALPRLVGITGSLARENAGRNPRRTASTAAALAIGITLVTFITVFADSATTSIAREVDRNFRGDFLVTDPTGFGFGGVSPTLADNLSTVEGVSAVAALKVTDASIITAGPGSAADEFVTGVDPASYPRLFDAGMARGSLAELEPGRLVVDVETARDEGLAIGDPVTVTSASERSVRLRIVALSDDPGFLGEWTMTTTDFARLVSEPLDALIGIRLTGGTGLDDVRADLRAEVAAFPTMALQDREQFTSSLADQITTLLSIVYGLLAVSVVIALIGIANTLSLSIHERTRELGLLRAMGMTRRQVRAMVRWEALLVALIGTVLGLGLGLGLARTVVAALASEGLDTFSAPAGPLVVIVIVGAGLGVLAALRPARRAARLDVLDAIAAE